MNTINKSRAILGLLLVSFTIFSLDCSREKDYVSIMAVTGATPLALRESVKSGTTLEISGLTKKVYTFDQDALSAFTSTYIRSREVSPDGTFLGTYRYTGIPLVHILEGIAPKKPENAAFDKPLDIVVTFESASGAKASFSYGELTMGDDANPVILAYDRKEVLPNELKKGEVYKHNAYHDNIKGLRLVCPAEPDTARYLDDVKKIIFSEPKVSYTGLPPVKKGSKCESTSIKGVIVDKETAVTFNGVERSAIKDWVRTGHGKGYKGISSASGYNLVSFLKKNFPGSGPDNYYLFVACDGYRALFSGREIFLTEAGKAMMLINILDGKKPSGGYMLGPVKDYFVDRDVWGLSHIVVLDEVQ